jgi:thiamine-monophosphate kinase
LGEFDLIKRYFTAASYPADVLLGVGDDAAVLAVPAGYRLVAAVDTLVEGVHFPVGTSAADIAYRALAVNLSDMAAMGAQPRWFTLSLCMPESSESWVAAFALSLQQLAARYKVQLVGGDTVKGPLNISLQILGLVKEDGWLTRAGAAPGDVIFVSGVPGEAAGGLQLLQSQLAAEPQHRQH